MIEEVQIKILRLNTGEDIIGACINDEANSSIDIESPMRVVIRRMTPPGGKTILLMSPWLPFELVEDDFASINYADIITVINPNKQFIEYYTNTVIEYKNKFSSSEGEDFMDEIFEDEGDEEFDEELEKAINESKKGMLH